MNLTPTTIRHDKVLLGKGVSQGKKNGRIEEWIFAMFGETWLNKILLYTISLNEKIKWLKFLFTSPLQAKK